MRKIFLLALSCLQTLVFSQGCQPIVEGSVQDDILTISYSSTAQNTQCKGPCTINFQSGEIKVHNLTPKAQTVNVPLIGHKAEVVLLTLECDGIIVHDIVEKMIIIQDDFGNFHPEAKSPDPSGPISSDGAGLSIPSKSSPQKETTQISDNTGLFIGAGIVIFGLLLGCFKGTKSKNVEEKNSETELADQSELVSISPIENRQDL